MLYMLYSIHARSVDTRSARVLLLLLLLLLNFLMPEHSALGTMDS